MPLPLPDANGYVKVMWPSKTIPHGGVFHTRKADTSEKSREYIKLLLEETKLAIQLREKTKMENRARAAEEQERQSRPRQQYIVRPKTSKRRSLSTIMESGVYEEEGFVPMKRGEDREQLKERLQALMAYGDSDQQQPTMPKTRFEKKPPTLPTAKDMRNELLTQIRERADWLADMEMLGEAARHRDIIKDQIAERFRAIEALGLDTPLSSARSGSGFSTLRSREKVLTARSNASKKVSARSDKNAPLTGEAKQTEKKKIKTARNKHKPVEHVAAYNNYQPLVYSPRRRC